MKTANLGDYLMFDGKLMKVVGINQGHRAILMESIDHKSCPHCGGDIGVVQIDVIESSKMFQDLAMPMQTIK